MEKRETEQTKLSFEQIRDIIDNRIALMEESGESQTDSKGLSKKDEKILEEESRRCCFVIIMKRLFRRKCRRK